MLSDGKKNTLTSTLSEVPQPTILPYGKEARIVGVAGIETRDERQHSSIECDE
jgi:hypothetical protein